MHSGSPASPRQVSEQVAPRLPVAPRSPPSPGIDLPLATRPGRGHGVQALRWGDDGRGHSFIFPTPQGCRGAVAVPKNAVKAQAALQARRCLGTGAKDGLGRGVETNLQQAGAGDSRGKAACTPGPALRSRGGTAGKPGALPQLPAAAAAGGEKVVGDRGAAGWGWGCRGGGKSSCTEKVCRMAGKRQRLSQQVMPSQKQGLKTLGEPAGPSPSCWGTDTSIHHGTESAGRTQALLHLIHSCPITAFGGMDQIWVFFSKIFPTNPNPNSSGVLLVRAPDFCSCPELPPHKGVSQRLSSCHEGFGDCFV